MKYYIVYNFDNTPVDTFEGSDADLENYILGINKKGFRMQEVPYSKYKRIQNRMNPSNQLLNFVYGGFIIAIILVIIFY